MKAFSILCTSALFSATFTQAKDKINREEFLNKDEVKELLEYNNAQDDTIEFLRLKNKKLNSRIISLERMITDDLANISTNQENIRLNTLNG